MGIDLRADANAEDSKGARPLDLAIAQGHAIVSKHLLHRRADLNSPGSSAAEKIAVAMERGHMAVVRLLQKMASGANHIVSGQPKSLLETRSDVRSSEL